MPLGQLLPLVLDLGLCDRDQRGQILPQVFQRHCAAVSTCDFKKLVSVGETDLVPLDVASIQGL